MNLWVRTAIRYAGLALALYWTALFIGTHMPLEPQPFQPVPYFDKWLHVVGYAGLAFIAATAWRARRPLGPMQYALLLLGLTIRPPKDPLVRGRTDAADATLLGFFPFYFLMIASHYYWVNRILPLVHHARHEEDGLEHVAGLVILFGIEIASNAIDEETHFRYGLTGSASVALGVYAAWVIGSRLVRAYRGEER